MGKDVQSTLEVVCEKAAPSLAAPKHRARIPAQLAHINSVREACAAQRRAEIWRLRVAGLTQREIGLRVGLSEDRVGVILRESLAAVREEGDSGAEGWRAIQLARYEQLLAAWLPLALQPGKMDAEKAAAIVIRGLEAQARLVGLDRADLAPVGLRPGVLWEKLRASPQFAVAVRALQDRLAKDPAVDAAPTVGERTL